ncbi:hypothetical protein TPHA_0C03220 [Tetrapisispora phaffii CBS 4417]|uniref:Uncharacterized protein n=1 Tax=Tetrapisispora phaffii (strain ATCC 24235 / CBS 4417 / NBRC 1672 / NRRL Y-8282 / UCD 70-5) TaxID=1071381 RepID=G8BRU9_TETPH|nr:hypothetical protein TPHA_0C03220 [Tetrapisispora phaffii CBS 4417]CCE62475.1 hypothetical protein TPHA_0C03220 [Tetrapisispora phaffii CBS 4417]
MNHLKIVSRKDLYDEPFSTIDDESLEGNNRVILAEPIFEIVEVDNINNKEDSNKGDSNNENDDEENNQVHDEFDFPLFSFGASFPISNVDQVETNSEDIAGRGGSEVKLMKISLREPSPEITNTERPDSYYFATYTEDDKRNFEKSAIEFDAIFEDKAININRPGKKHKIIVLEDYNKKINELNERANILRKRRPGKKQRVAKKLAKEKIKEREQLLKTLKKEKKKMFNKRGGKKNKKKETLNPLKDAAATIIQN